MGKRYNVLPGFGLTMGFTLFYLSAIVLFPLGALVLKVAGVGWDEFWRVVKGDGPCNRERLAARNKAHAEGAWVREAATAYASKRASSSEAA